MNLTSFAIQKRALTYFAVFLLIVGGIASYLALGQLEDPEYTVKTAVIITAYPGASAKEVELALGNGTLLVDNRSRAEYLGIYGGNGKERAGRLPQSRHLNYDWLTVNGSGSLHSIENLKRIYATSQVALTGEQINYCHTGNRAALGWFVSHEILGNRQAKLYDGSTQEWAADQSLPMEQQVKLSY